MNNSRTSYESGPNGGGGRKSINNIKKNQFGNSTLNNRSFRNNNQN